MNIIEIESATTGNHECYTYLASYLRERGTDQIDTIRTT